jgi:type I restriction enzyme S subunit
MTVWQTQALAEACEIKPQKSEARNRLSGEDLVSFVPMEDLGVDEKSLVPTQKRALADVIGSYTYFADGDVLLAKITPCFENGKLGIAAGLENGVGFGSSEYIVFRPGPLVDRNWLYYFLSRDSFRMEGEARMGGAVGHKRVAKEFIENYQVPIAPIEEQQRIVAILDEAFAGIATAKANAEKNLQSARAIFSSHLKSWFTQQAGWTTKTLDQISLNLDSKRIPMSFRTTVHLASSITWLTTSSMKTPCSSRRMAPTCSPDRHRLLSLPQASTG